MMRAWWILILASVGASGQPTYDTLQLERVASGLTNPLWVTAAPGDPDHVFIVEQRDSQAVGRVKVLDLESGEVLETPFLEVPDVTTASEEGLLGLAFHPDYAENRQFYVYYTTNDASVNPASSHGVSRIERYLTTEGDAYRADPESATTVLTFPQPFRNHNGGWIAFGPGGNLYVATGDGGGGNDDPLNASQSLEDNPETDDANESRLGKLLRLDVDGDDFPDDANRNYAIPDDNPFAAGGGAPEIWAFGLRNPWRPSFDRETDDLWIADVGQGKREEINFRPASSQGGENYGWRVFEGSLKNDAVDDPIPESPVFPVLDYTRDIGWSVTGGYVYRGDAMPWLHGNYIYGDFGSAFVRSFRLENGAVTDQRDWTDALAQSLPDGQSLDSVSSFGEDLAGELYIVDLGGEVFRLTQAPYLLWQNRHFTKSELEAGELSARDADADADGVINGVEFVLGGDPRGRDRPDEAQVEIVEEAGNRYLEAVWQLNPDAAGTYTLAVVKTGNLVDFESTGVSVIEEEPTHYRVRMDAPVGETPQFLRLDVDISEE